MGHFSRGFEGQEWLRYNLCLQACCLIECRFTLWLQHLVTAGFRGQQVPSFTKARLCQELPPAVPTCVRRSRRQRAWRGSHWASAAVSLLLSGAHHPGLWSDAGTEKGRTAGEEFRLLLSFFVLRVLMNLLFLKCSQVKSKWYTPMKYIVLLTFI